MMLCFFKLLCFLTFFVVWKLLLEHHLHDMTSLAIEYLGVTTICVGQSEITLKICPCAVSSLTVEVRHRLLEQYTYNEDMLKHVGKIPFWKEKLAEVAMRSEKAGSQA